MDSIETNDYISPAVRIVSTSVGPVNEGGSSRFVRNQFSERTTTVTYPPVRSSSRNDNSNLRVLRATAACTNRTERQLLLVVVAPAKVCGNVTTGRHVCAADDYAHACRRCRTSKTKRGDIIIVRYRLVFGTRRKTVLLSSRAHAHARRWCTVTTLGEISLNRTAVTAVALNCFRYRSALRIHVSRARASCCVVSGDVRPEEGSEFDIEVLQTRRGSNGQPDASTVLR